MTDDTQTSNDEAQVPRNFIQRIIDEDVANNKNDSRVITRFPPEPNGYLHIGHAKSICLNFGLAESYGGVCHLRFDDTNPEKEDIEFVESIKKDVSWLGFDWRENIFFASDYYGQLYQFAQELIKLGKAYVCNLNAEQTRLYRGTLTEAGKPSPNRDLSVDENLDLFSRMRAGEFNDGEFVLRAKIDMASANLNMRDPVLYRIKRAHHFRTGNEWCIYPMYDFTHCLSDAIEGITHSICTLEFEDHRPLYDWILETLSTVNHPQQIEFSRLNLGYTVMSKRKLQELVKENHVTSWDDPRMPTISGMRRRGYPAASIRNFCSLIGVGRSDSWIDYAVLEETVREELNRDAPRAMAVLNPLKLVIENYPVDKEETCQAKNHPMIPEMGTRDVPFSREIYIERDDFMEEPIKKFFRLAPGKEVRLRYAYLVTCTSVVKDPESGEIIEVRCTYDPESKGGNAPDGRKVKGTIHWVSAQHSVSPEVRLFDRLFSVENPDGADGDYRDHINPKSENRVSGCQLEPSLMAAPAGTVYQFERLGYFCLDQKLMDQGEKVFIRTVGLRDSWGKAK